MQTSSSIRTLPLCALVFLSACVGDELPPPSLELTATPAALTASTAAHFEFTSEDTDEFRCTLDGEAIVPCQSPLDLTVDEGTHLFEVLAVIADLESETASYEWTVDLSGPDTVIDTHPATETAETGAAFTFHATETGSTFECRLDDAAFAACTSGKSYTGLALGAHRFEVRGIDSLGNLDPTPASFSWTIGVPACQLGNVRTEKVVAYPDLTNNVCGITAAEFGAQGLIAVPATWLDTAAACGTCYEVTGAGGTAIAVVGEQTGSMLGWTAELNQSLFEKVTGQIDDIHDVTMRPIRCPAPTNIRVRMEGANAFYTNIRFSAHATPIASAALVTGPTTSISLTRTSYNTFQQTGSVGSGPYKLRVTDTLGTTVELMGVPLMTNNSDVHQSAVQFDSCQ
jgi:expansin (peptidoglycan-binding protein)